MAASLAAMVARLTVGKAKYADVWDCMEALASQAERLSAFFQKAVERDEAAFQALLASRKLPKETEAQQAARQSAIEAATIQAGEVPLEVAEQALKVMELARQAAELGNVNAITDASAAAMLARTALSAAGLNVRINASGLADSSIAQKWEAALCALERQGDEVLQQVRANLSERAGLKLGV
jgi:glutamate formiminotransferase/formiminotetrahydrofolate cyclodeaminase